MILSCETETVGHSQQGVFRADFFFFPEKVKLLFRVAANFLSLFTTYDVVPLSSTEEWLRVKIKVQV